MKHYHLAGIAGSGMSALAEALLDAGHRVSGSDRFLDQGRELTVLRKLAAAGIALHAQDGSALEAGMAGLVVSTAIEDDNPELLRARALGIPELHRAEMLRALSDGSRLIAIAGTAGKTTTTGLTGWILEQAGLDPTVVNGGAVVPWISEQRLGSVRRGSGELFVAEVDESDKSLLRFEPDTALITNISLDHFGLEETCALFRDFRARVTGTVLCGSGVPELLGEAAGPLVEISAVIRPGPAGWTFETAGRVWTSPLPGRHNAENALHAVRLCLELGVEAESIADALSRFTGIERRLQRCGRAKGMTVVDDYAHNPAKIGAAWRTMQEESERVLGVWKPHGFGPLATMGEELAGVLKETLRDGDRLYLLPVFYAGGTAGGSADSDAYAETLQRAGIAAEFVPGYAELGRRITGQLRSGDAVLCMGARDPDLPRFAHELAGAL